MGTNCDNYLCESTLWNHGRIQTTAPAAEWARENDDVASAESNKSTESKSLQEHIRIARAREKLVGLSSMERDRTSSHDDGEAQKWCDNGDAVRQCHGCEETARVHCMRCRATSEASWRQVVA